MTSTGMNEAATAATTPAAPTATATNLHRRLVLPVRAVRAGLGAAADQDPAVVAHHTGKVVPILAAAADRVAVLRRQVAATAARAERGGASPTMRWATPEAPSPVDARPRLTPTIFPTAHRKVVKIVGVLRGRQAACFSPGNLHDRGEQRHRREALADALAAVDGVHQELTAAIRLLGR